MPKAMVVDLSHHNVIPEGLEAAAASGIVGVIHKLTEGSSYVDDDVQARRHLALEAGLCWGVYHFMHPGNARDQAEFFYETGNALGVADEATVWVCDWEDAPGKGPASLADVLEFLVRLEQLTGRLPVVYSGHVLKEALGESSSMDAAIREYPLWLCHYGVDKPTLPAGYDDYWLWQYSETGTCPGIQTPVDLNQYVGTAEELRAEWLGEPLLGGETRPGGGRLVEPAVLITVRTRGLKPEQVRVVIEADEDE